MGVPIPIPSGPGYNKQCLSVSIRTPLEVTKMNKPHHNTPLTLKQTTTKTPQTQTAMREKASYQNVHHGLAEGSLLVLKSSMMLNAWTHACHPPAGRGPLLHTQTHIAQAGMHRNTQTGQQ